MKKFIFLFVLVIYSTPCFADAAEWRAHLASLTENMPRAQAENVIAAARTVKTTYDINAMDIRRTVVYRLDEEFVLVANYEPGMPRARAAEPGQGETMPIDGHLISYEVIRID